MASGRTMSCKSRDLLIGIGSQRSTREYCDKEKIYSQGDIATAMYYVESGHVKLTVASANGNNAVLAILGKGDFLGQDCLVNGAKRTTTATALQPSIITRGSFFMNRFRELGLIEYNGSLHVHRSLRTFLQGN